MFGRELVVFEVAHCQPVELLGTHGSSTIRRSWWHVHQALVYWSNLFDIIHIIVCAFEHWNVFNVSNVKECSCFVCLKNHHRVKRIVFMNKRNVVWKKEKNLDCFKMKNANEMRDSPSGSNILGISKYFSATSNAVFKFSNGLSFDNLP